MKLLPFEFVVRDILYATYPNFAQLQPQNVQVKTVHMKNVAQTQSIFINQQHVLNILHQDAVIELDNLQVPYQMVISALHDRLETTE